jgi:predicted DNA-binding transcriptional regulator AlpA
MPTKKVALTFEERVTAAYMHFIRHVDQQDIAECMGGVNIGRVNEACKAVKRALRGSGKARYIMKQAELDLQPPRPRKERLKDRVLRYLPDVQTADKVVHLPSNGLRRLIAAAQAAELLQVSRASFYRLKQQGKIPTPIQLGPKSHRWYEDEIIAWRDKQRGAIQ